MLNNKIGHQNLFLITILKPKLFPNTKTQVLPLFQGELVPPPLFPLFRGNSQSQDLKPGWWGGGDSFVRAGAP